MPDLWHCSGLPIKAITVSATQRDRQLGRAAALVLGCALVGSVVGIFAKPPGGIAQGAQAGTRVGVWVGPVANQQLVKAHVPKSNKGVPAKAEFWRPPGQVYGGNVLASASDRNTALEFAITSAIDYVRTLTRHENNLMLRRRSSESKRIRRLQSSIIQQPSRFGVAYEPAAAPARTTARASWRTALIGAMVGVLLLCVGRLVAIRPRVPVAAAGALSGVAGRLPEVSGVRAAVLA